MKLIFPLSIGLICLILAVLPNTKTANFTYSATVWPRIAFGLAAAYFLIAAYGAFNS